MSAYYFDDEEKGVARATSHPFFVEHATADFYYSLEDDFSPFGNDAGADMLFYLQDWFSERSQEESIIDFLLEFLKLNHPTNLDYLKCSQPQQLNELDASKQIYYDDIDHFIIATAFGQCKISGIIDIDLFTMADNSLFRQYFLTKKAEQEGNPWPYAAQYLQRLEIMRDDLNNMANKKAR